MEAKDTVMTDKEMTNVGWVDAEFEDSSEGVVCNELYDIRKILEAQAEISFKAGMKEALTPA